MNDDPAADTGSPSRVVWFAAGALTIAAALALFLYVDGFFAARAELDASAGSSRTIIEGQ
ncbi:hypothetical protein [Kumtagia ephedrae]|jgi:hypothetical protein|uniref:Uncharacterized protein n=1 Tax=Kumtagia ephedrae TaxID=2116701 RepID=A0A2P7SSZ9_9HYPH|nr:hypothetical protein [Mesorhizobium ephedrae]PSJ65604.1 hypothetical protein C7I84_00280 [Mesorhizobium ephedrae]